MEINRHICTQLIEKTRSFSQITLDDDYIVRDNKPDVLHIHATGKDGYEKFCASFKEKGLEKLSNLRGLDISYTNVSKVPEGVPPIGIKSFESKMYQHSE